LLTIDEIEIAAPVAACFRAAADVERWPEILPHYRWVTFQRRDGLGRGLVEMAARRPLGPLPYPVWWVSEMTLDETRPAVIYRHVQGITTGMDVEWTFEAVAPGSTRVRIVHEWEEGPHWPLPGIARRMIADRVIGPAFIQHVASRTLRGIKREVEGEGPRPSESDHGH
jgi:ribosome-associated toxin RatA of RatAB toxin-antitoxin module